MQLDWSTFVLQIINFLVLVWLLKLLLYRPVFNIITERQRTLETIRTEADQIRTESETLREKYAHRLTEWEREKAKAREQLHEELTEERTRALQETQALLIQEQERARAIEEQRMRRQLQEMETTALELARRLVTALLSRLAGPDLDARILDLVVEDIQALPEDQRAKLRNTGEHGEADVRTPRELKSDQQERLTRTLEGLFGHPLTIHWIPSPDLIAGIEIRIGAWILNATLRGELQWFFQPTPGENL
jgi:F-type H+-transporting ATPase subunit b